MAAEVRELRAMLAELVGRTPQPLGTVEQAAEMLQRSPAVIRQLCRTGQLPSQRVGKTWRIDLAACRVATDAEVDAAVRARR